MAYHWNVYVWLNRANLLTLADHPVQTLPRIKWKLEGKLGILFRQSTNSGQETWGVCKADRYLDVQQLSVATRLAFCSEHVCKLVLLEAEGGLVYAVD